MGITELAVLLAGFALAHAAWSISDVPKDELLVPLAIVQDTNGQRHVQRFEAESQVEAVEAGKAAMAKLVGGTSSYAFVREGLLPINGVKSDILTLDFWSPGMEKPVTVIQQFRPAWSTDGFQVVGDPMIVIDGRQQPAENMREVVALLRAGIAQHGKAGPLWSSWVK